MTAPRSQSGSLHAFIVSCGICSGLLYVSESRLCRRRARSHRWARSNVGIHALQNPEQYAVPHLLPRHATGDALSSSSIAKSRSPAADNQNSVELDATEILKDSLRSRPHGTRTALGQEDESNANPNDCIGDNKSEIDPDFTSDKSQRLFLVDGFGILYRSYYALVKTTMSSKDMFDTRAVYGFTNVLLSLLQKHVKGNPVVVVFEGRKKPGELDHRTAEYPEYKADRGPTPAGVIAAIPVVKRMVRALGLATIEQNLFEADDVIGTIVRRAKRAGIFSVIVSIDKDFRQLLDRDFVSILKPGTNSRPFEYVTEDSFREEYSDLHPSRYVDILTLIGDAADSIKGVPGIGPRTAPKLIKHFGSLEAVLAAARSIEEQDKSAEEKPEGYTKGRSKKSKDDGKSALRKILPKRHASSLTYYEQRTLMMKNMVTIRDNVNLPDFSWQKFRRRPVQEDEIKEISRFLEFSSSRLISRMLHSADDVPERFIYLPKVEEVTVSTVDAPVLSPDVQQLEAKAIVKNMCASEQRNEFEIGTYCAPSTESYRFLVDDEEIEEALSGISSPIGLSMVVAKTESGKSKMKGVAVSTEPQRSLFIDCTGKELLPDALVRILSDPAVEKVGWFMKENAKCLLSSHNIFLHGRLFDVRIAADLLHAGQRLTDSSLASVYLWEGALKRWLSDGKVKQLSCPEEPEDALALSDLGFQIGLKLKAGLLKEKLDRVAQQVEFPLIPVLAEMEINGVPCEAEDLSTFEAHVKSRLVSVEKSLRLAISKADDAEGRFRPTSRDDVAKLLFETWKLPIKVKPSASGKYPANKRVLSMVANDQRIPAEKREFAQLMIEHREVSKILNTYTRSLIDAIHSDGRIRTTFVQDASSSGRLSTSRPNLQSIPSRSQLGRKVRSTVCASPGFSILCADYSQIELRIIAALSGDPALREAFADGVDVHTAVAARIFGVKNTGLITKEQRTKAKEVSYGIPYGISAHGLAQQLNVPQRDAKNLIAGFHEQFPLVKQYTQKLIDSARRDGFAQTMFGRKLPLPLLLHGGAQERRAAERVAVNMPIQGTQADMIKLAMVRISSRLRAAKAESKLILQVHDELVLEVKHEEREAVQAMVEEEMENALPLPGVSVVVDVGFGESWLSAASH